MARSRGVRAAFVAVAAVLTMGALTLSLASCSDDPDVLDELAPSAQSVGSTTTPGAAPSTAGTATTTTPPTAPASPPPSAPVGEQWRVALPFDPATTFPPLGEAAVTLWVEAGAAGGDGSATSPLPSISDALARAGPGEVIGVRAGTYDEEVRSVRAGKPDAPIRIVGFGATIRGSGYSGRLVTITHDHVTLEGFTLTGADKLVWVQGASGVRIVGNVLDGAGGECIRMKYHAVANEVAHNVIRNCGRTNFDLDDDHKNGEGVYVGTAPEQLDRNPSSEIDRSDHNWIHDNQVATPAECVDIKEGSSGNLVSHNTCSAQQDPDGSGYDSRGNANYFVANVATDLVGAGVRLGGDSEEDGIGNVVVGNRLEHTEGYGIKVMRSSQGLMCGNVLDANDDGELHHEDDDHDDEEHGERPSPEAPCP